MIKDLISIIIPTYNRGHYLEETLNSIINQTYQYWECIIIDDGSTDNSKDVISVYLKKDTRFHYSMRPSNLPKGANSCRNYGFSLATGAFVKWFDSDDIMVPIHLETLIGALKLYKVDFVVGDSENFEDKTRKPSGKPYQFNREKIKITPEAFAKQQIGWITDDFLGKREILENIKFNESIKTDGDEYNFFTQLLHENTNGVFVNKILTYRRLHKHALSYTKDLSDIQFNIRVANIKYLTFQDIKKYKNKELLCWFLSGYMQYSFKICLEGRFPPFFIKSISQISKYFGKIKAANFLTALIFARYYGRGYKFLEKSTRY